MSTKQNSYTLPIVITLAASFVVVAGFIAALILLGKDPGPFLSDIITLVGILPTLGAVGVIAGSSARKTDAVIQNTNGNLSKLQAQNQAMLSVMNSEQVSQANQILAGHAATVAKPATAPVTAPVAVSPEVPAQLAPAPAPTTAMPNLPVVPPVAPHGPVLDAATGQYTES